MKSSKPSMRWILTLCAAVLVAGCASPASNGNYCDIATPIWWNSTEELDATPDPIVRQIVEHNETVVGLCQ